MIVRPFYNLYAKKVSDTVGYGVYSSDFIAKDSIVENTYMVKIDDRHAFYDYYFGNKDEAYMPLGFACIYNHSDNPNLGKRRIGDILQFYALTDIHPETQLCHLYPGQYWKKRKKEKENFN